MGAIRKLGTFLTPFAGAVLVMYIMGDQLPREHTATASVTIHAPQSRVWQIITDVPAQTRWRSGLTRVEPLPAENGRPCWKEFRGHDGTPFCETEAKPPDRRVTRITDPNLDFGGTWTYQLTAANSSSTQVSITENGTIGPPLWRFFGHYVFHEDTTIKGFLDGLKREAEKR